MTTRFDDCLAFVAKWEGGYTNDPVDRGGATNLGITQSTLDKYLDKHNKDYFDVKSLTSAEARIIYFDEYWVPSFSPRMMEPLDLLVFDTAVNMGVGRSAKILQTSLGVTADGVIGAITLGALHEEFMAGAIRHLCLDYWGLREDRYNDIIKKDPKQIRFKRGWHNRMVSLMNEMNKSWK